MRAVIFIDTRCIPQAKVWALVLLGMLSASCANSANNYAASPSLPVFVHPDVNVTAYLPSEASNISLAEQLITPWVMSVEMQTVDASMPNMVNSCKSALKADASGLEPAKPSMSTTLQYAVVQCRAVLLASRLKPAAKSFMSDFALNEASIKALPIAVLFRASTSEKAKLAQQFTRIGEAADIKDISKTDEYEVSYSEGSGQQTLKLVGRGDLNGDGIEDIVLLVTNSVSGGSYRATKLFTLTRVSKNMGIEILALED